MKIYLVTRAQNLSSYYTVTTITVTVPRNKKLPVINQTRFLRNIFLFVSPYFSKYIYICYGICSPGDQYMGKNNFCARGLGIHYCLTRCLTDNFT